MGRPAIPLEKKIANFYNLQTKLKRRERTISDLQDELFEMQDALIRAEAKLFAIRMTYKRADIEQWSCVVEHNGKHYRAERIYDKPVY